MWLAVFRRMGVDVVIAVDVEFPLYKLDELQSAITISEQVLTILIRKETLRQIEKLGEELNIVGAYPVCGAMAGSRSWDGAFDIRLVYDVVCGGVAPIPGGETGLPAPQTTS